MKSDTPSGSEHDVDYQKRLESHLVQLARLALSGRAQDIQMYVRRAARELRRFSPHVATELSRHVGSSLPQVVRKSTVITSVPIDHESRLQLAKYEEPQPDVVVPILHHEILPKLERLIMERFREAELYQADLHPTRTVLFTGPPGVGKTLVSRWVAAALNRPLVTLDLAAVMSSFLGRTGNNVRQVLDYAKSTPCVLLLDEFDAIAKRRDDSGEIGELKRLVTVLLQEIDDWPATGLLIAATNHPNLLDPAIWRRFELIIDFPLPDDALIATAIHHFLGRDAEAVPVEPLVALFRGRSFSDIERDMALVRRESVLSKRPVPEILIGLLRTRFQSTLSRHERHSLAEAMVRLGLSQREVSELTGVSRDTIRKRTPRKAIED
jgi:SpoVK/Ycf46/Vps4 family AAA+-type ATPase